MARYRARICPNCDYYVAFSISEPIIKPNEARVTSFCLNCGYKIPVRAIVRGIRRAASPVRRGLLRLANAREGADEPQQGHGDTPGQFSDCARDLRTIGQDLGNLRLTEFNLECTASAYLVWPREAPPFSSFLPNRRLRKLLHERLQPRSYALEEFVTTPRLTRIKRYRYTAREIERIEKAGCARRRSKSALADGHSLSQLLRTAGALVSQRNQKLLAISWQELSVSVVFETERGQKGIDVFRPDQLYDQWVRMYLRRNHRAFSDVPG